MTLDELATHVCEVTRQENDDALAVCKRFINKRYKVIWNECLWKESVVQYNGTLALTGTPDAYNSLNMGTNGYYLFPSWVDRIMAVRLTNGILPVQSTHAIIETTPDLFDQSGVPAAFQVLSPCVYMHVGSPDEGVYIIADSAADAGVIAHVTLYSGAGVRTVNDIALTTGSQLLGTVGTIESFSKPVTDLTVTITTPTNDIELNASETCYSPHPRIQLLPKPTTNTAFKTLVKKKPSELVNDSDCPEIRSVDSCLMALAMGDMLRRARQYAKAQELFSEGVALLEQLKQVNVVQEANRITISPDVSDVGYDDDFLRTKW